MPSRSEVVVIGTETLAQLQQAWVEMTNKRSKPEGAGWFTATDYAVAVKLSARRSRERLAAMLKNGVVDVFNGRTRNNEPVRYFRLLGPRKRA